MVHDNRNFVWHSASSSHVGIVRKVNEDNHLEENGIGLWAVADGMGGHEAGDVASEIVIDSLRGITTESNRRALLMELRNRLFLANCIAIFIDRTDFLSSPIFE